MKKLRLVCILFVLDIVSGIKIDSDVLKNYSEFFNFGGKKLATKLERNKYENSIFKSKVDILGSVFKVNVDLLKQQGTLDLVFLIDASSSVGEYNFKSELKFVKKLLSDVTVDFNHTRVALVTFSSQDDIVRNIDEISNPKESNNKCLLLNNEINNIKYRGGGTYTLGAFKMAQEIFKSSRDEARKVLFLITDGFSNGGDPVPIANELKKSQVTIFTIGIINGNYKELYELSSEPGEMYSYLLDSFEEFEGLARRALHVDLQSGDYIPLGTDKPCDALCSSENCCDTKALCTCGTTTGHYNCLCQLGYYGSGLKGSCSPCPSGSYASGPNLCLPCPDIHHYTESPAIGIGSCTCKPGYQSTKENGCEVIRCPKFKPPENGYFVNREQCGNVLNSACGVRCDVGYTLTGSSIRLCQLNGTWSGEAPTCQVKTCKKLTPPIHGSMSCKHFDLGQNFTTNENYPVDTVCSFSCEKGRTLIGSSTRTCLPLAQWDGLRTLCKQIKCNKLSKINHGTIEPKTCTLSKQAYGKSCNISCDEGFQLVGPSQKTCSGQFWDTQEEIYCKDITKPNITCPDDVQGVTLKGKPYGMVIWSDPIVTDNADNDVIIWTKPAIKNRETFKFKIGKTTVTYIAQDAANNKAKCSFVVEILDVEAPTIESCVDPPAFLSLSKEAENITWDEPIIYDNSQHVVIDKSHNFGTFPLGVTQVLYTATDSSNNTNTCLLNITIQESKCEILPDPIFGHSDCQPFSGSIHCVVTCEEGYAVPLSSPNAINIDDNATKFICQHSEPIWYNQDGGGFPECTVTELPTEINQTGVIEIEPSTPDDCLNNSTLEEIGNDIKATLQNSLKTHCNGINCKLETETKCVDREIEESEEKTNIIKRDITTAPKKIQRRRRKKKINVKFNLQTKSKGSNATIPTNALKVLHSYKGRNVTVKLDRPKVACPLGSFNRKYKCVRCPQGTFHNTTSNICQSCEIGFYNELMGQTSCKACPRFHSTRKLHAKSLNDCIDQCPPGTFARKKQIKKPKNHPNAIIERVTLKPYCRSCPIGQYQNDYSMLSCKNCPDGYTTQNRGAVEVQECIPKLVMQCNDTSICNSGKCVLENSFYYSCICNEFYVGAHCETYVGPCSSNPCQNNGKCVEEKNQFSCICDEGFRGKTCGEVVDKCDLDCKNNATCVETEENESICVCPKGFGGNLCEIKITYCREHLCENGGICEELSNGFNCLCRNGYIGHRCSYLPCDYRPCHENAICVNDIGNITNRDSYSCQCPPGLTGGECTIPINYCYENPCLNEGTCISEKTQYKCKCINGYQGKNCEEKLASDYVLYFPRSSITDFITLEGFEKDLSEISVCMWMHTEDNFNYGTLLSYATKHYDNAFTITDYTGLVLYINNNYVVTDVLLNDGFWHHFCMAWKSLNGQYELFLDGKKIQSGSNLSGNHTIKGKGKLVIGQEQDVLGGKFSQSESFLGRIAHLDIYSRALNLSDINYIMHTCLEDRFGDLVAWPELQNYLKGDIQIENSSFCQACPDPEPLYNGRVNVENNKAIYKCNKGFRLSDDQYASGRLCTKASEWEGNVNPYCKAVKCEHPGYVPNGYIIGRSFSYLDEIEYKCNYGFNLTGTNKRLCWDNGSWIPEAPLCLGVQCNNFELSKHASAVVVTEDEVELPFEEFSTGFNIGTQVEFRCDNKSLFEGEPMLSCLSDGTWDFDIPTCKSLEPEKKQLTCAMSQVPKPPLNGYIVEESLAKVKDGESDTVEYKCRREYRQIGENTSTCIIDGYWSELKLTCKAIACGDPPNVPKMKLMSGQTSGFQIGNMASYECLKGYKIFGNSKLRCLLPGIWSRMQAKCIRISCGKPNVSPDTLMMGNYLYNDKVTLVCNGETRTLTCGSDGKWIGDLTNC